MQIEMDPLVVEAMEKAARLTEDDKNIWTIASNALIRDGTYQELSVNGMEQAVDGVAFRIARCTVLAAKAGIALRDTEQMFHDDMVALDEIMVATAFSSRTHIDIIEAKVALRVQEYVGEMMQQLKS
jgi:hypothetical protein